jgi:perosamine synthetase
MNDAFIPQMEPWFGAEEAESVYAYMKEGGWITEFKRTERFEQLLAEFTGAKHCVVVNNGTISLTLAALACGVQAGDEVIVPNYTMIATPNSVRMIGAQPVFVDVDPATLCMDMATAERAITTKTRALMFVSANGRYPREGIEQFAALCRARGLVLIEDAAQSLGSRYPSGLHMGRVGGVGSFSFSAPKVISTGQGGALITDDDDLAFKLRRLKDFGRSRGGTDVHDWIGYNFKFTELQACIGIEQMAKLAARVERKKAILRLYRENLRGVRAVTFFAQDLAWTTPWFIDVLVEDRDRLMAHLKERQIGTRVMYPPIHRQKAYDLPGEHPVSEDVGRRGLWLPSASQLTDDQIARVCAAVHEFYA